MDGKIIIPGYYNRKSIRMPKVFPHILSKEELAAMTTEERQAIVDKIFADIENKLVI